MIRNWFRTRRALVAMVDDRGDIIAKQIDEIAELREELGAGWRRANDQINQLHRQRDVFRRGTQVERNLRVEAETKLARVVEELKALREDIRQAEGDEPSYLDSGALR